jgi:hypothetical protein
MYLYASYDAENRSGISLHTIKRLVIVMKMRCVLCEVGSGIRRTVPHLIISVVELLRMCAIPMLL